MSTTPPPPVELPLIDIGPLLDDRVEGAATATGRVGAEIDRACRELGFFRITGHELDAGSFDRLQRAAREFFGRPDHENAAISMSPPMVATDRHRTGSASRAVGTGCRSRSSTTRRGTPR